MRKKIAIVLNKAYGILMMVSFFAGFIPLFPYILALLIGGSNGESIAVFLYDEYYVWVIALASLAVVIGLISMYFDKKEGLSVSSVGKNLK